MGSRCDHLHLRILQDPGRILNSLTQLQPGQPDPAKWYEAALSDEYFRIMQRVKVNKDFFSRVVDKDGNTASSLLYGQMTSRIAGMQLKKGVNKASELPFLSSLLVLLYLGLDEI